jgi:hypothetical protein
MMHKFIVTAAAVSSLAFGAVGLVGSSGVVGAASSSTSTRPSTVSPAAHAARCAKAEELATKIPDRELKAATWLPKAQAREDKATTAGHTKRAALIAKRIARVQKLEGRGSTLLSKIAAKCGTTTS